MIQETLTALRLQLNELERMIAFQLKSRVEVNVASIEAAAANIPPLSPRPVTTLAFRSVQMAFMWLGKAKGAMGSANPYPQSTDASSAVIEPPQDQSENSIEMVFDDEVVFAKTARKQLSDVEHVLVNSVLEQHASHRGYQFAVTNALTFVCNAKMYLGLVLNEIKKEQDEEIAEQGSSDQQDSGDQNAPSMTASPGGGSDSAADDQSTQGSETAEAPTTPPQDETSNEGDKTEDQIADNTPEPSADQTEATAPVEPPAPEQPADQIPDAGPETPVAAPTPDTVDKANKPAQAKGTSGKGKNGKK